MKRNFLLVATLLSFVFAAPVTAFSQAVPTTLTFQGRLAKPGGTPVADVASQSLTFRLYDAASGGTLLWSQTATLPVKNGTFAARLDFSKGYATGQTLATVFSNPKFTPFLEIQVGTDAPLAPRQPFSSQAYALYANTALNVPDSSITSAKIAPGAIGS